MCKKYIISLQRKFYTNYFFQLIIMPYTYKYPHPAVTTDCVILTFHQDMLKILLVRRGIEPFKGEWALPGGFLKPDESAEECAYRELREETGVTGCKIKQFHTFSAPHRDPRERVITIAFYALMKWQQATGADDADYADWVPLEDIPKLAFDHNHVVEVAMETIKRDIFFEPVGFELLNEHFSMPELQKVYESILGKEFDRRNFAKKMKHLNILEEVEPEKSEKKQYPLPFLNDPAPVVAPVVASLPKASIINEDLAPDCDDEYRGCPPPAMYSEPKPRGRRSLLFRFNKNTYKKLKDDNTLEF